MKNTRRRKKKSSPKKLDEKKKEPLQSEEEEQPQEPEGNQITVLDDLVNSFNLSSMEEDPERASEILRKKGLVYDPSSVCSSSTSSSSSGGGGGVSDLGSTYGSSEGFVDVGYGEDVGCFKGNSRQKKKVIAATGTVSTVIGKEYVRRNKNKNKGFENNGVVDKDKAEQFLCSMLGNDSDLNLGVVRDVFSFCPLAGQCGYDIEKALDVLLDLTASMNEQPRNDNDNDNIYDMRFLVGHKDNLIDRRSECTSLSSESEVSDQFWSLGSFNRNYADALTSSKANSHISPGITKSELPQKVLESLFNIPKSSEHDKGTMNWRNVVKKMQSLGPEFDVSPHVSESQQPTFAKGAEYHVFREGAKQHWDSVKSYFQKASTAYAKGDRSYAAYLSDQGKEQTKIAQKADTKASHDIFIARNKGIENVITIDLHGQHVKPAMRMLKLHLLFGSYVPSVQTLRVITGCGSHGVGKSKLKQSVVNLLHKERMEWCEENRGTLLIKLNGWREFSFLDTDSDSDSN
ncbi:SMR domain-containing protein At5g58720 isoform X4 [Arachis ipaensis]|uniref:SMR domain-containing protein At5g58720 isoform X4 n=1 Tax=Arachis ipaensis TaxID=130454 RepID=UPI000A2B4027|nr:SMR domain-containing protein At5g58720 isoform X4 [Arachis ipaensis]